MQTGDRDMERAEEDAARMFSTEGRQSLENARRTSNLSSSSSSATSTSISTRQDLYSNPSMGRTPTANDLQRRRTCALEMHRTETHRLQHSYTVGSSPTRTRTSQKPLPNFGGGKPYPPLLPAQEEYVVEYDGEDDPLHPQNWSSSRK